MGSHGSMQKLGEKEKKRKRKKKRERIRNANMRLFRDYV